MSIKKVVVAGSRFFTDYEKAEYYINKCLLNLKKKSEIVIISGTCRGADLLGEEYARKHRLVI